MPRASVIISTYNRSHFICDAIDSVLNQTFKDFEIIVVDDGSTDNTRQVLERYGSSIYYIYQQSQGRAEARNTGIEVAKGEYIAFLDDDDIWLPYKLEKQVAFLDSRSNIGLVHTFSELIDEHGHLLQEATRKRLKLYKKAMKVGYTYEGMGRLCVMFISTVMVRRECLDGFEFFDSHTETFEDWDFYLRFSLKYRIGTIAEPLVRFRIHKAHSTLSEFTHGRIQTSMKHLAMLDSCNNLPFRNRIRHNFYLHLANAYYIDMQLIMFRTYALKALKLNPLTLFRSRLGLHFLLSLLPPEVSQAIRQLKDLQFRKTYLYPERISPEETFGGPLAAHLKRYDFAKSFCVNKIVLDAACGAGYGSHYLAKVAKEVIGVDTSCEAIAYAKEHYQRENIQFKVMDVHNLEFLDRYFDMVCSFETLEHLDKPERFLSEVKRVLNEDGIFVVSTPNVKKTSHNPKNPYHKLEFCKKDFEDVLKKYFISVEIFGQRRLQSLLHYYLQKIDIFHLRSILPNFVMQKICHTVATRSWDEADLKDFIISKGIRRATELIGVCRLPVRQSL